MKEKKIPKNKEPMKEWIESKNSFLSDFEEYYEKQNYS